MHIVYSDYMIRAKLRYISFGGLDATTRGLPWVPYLFLLFSGCVGPTGLCACCDNMISVLHSHHVMNHINHVMKHTTPLTPLWRFFDIQIICSSQQVGDNTKQDILKQN